MITQTELIKNAVDYTGLDEKQVKELLIEVEGHTERFLHAMEDIKHGCNYSIARNLYSQRTIKLQ